MRNLLFLFSLSLSLLASADEILDGAKDTYPYWECDFNEIAKENGKMSWPKHLRPIGAAVRAARDKYIPTVEFGEETALKKLARSIGRLELGFQRADGSKFGTTCTAEAVSEDHILTNAHCVPGDPQDKRFVGSKLIKAAVRFGYYNENDNGDLYEVDITPFEYNHERDYAILNVRGEFASKWGTLPLGNVTKREPTLDDELVLIHHSAGLPQKISLDCKFRPVNGGEVGDDVNLIHSCASAPGSSGAPLFRKVGDEYEFIGLHFAGSLVDETVRVAKRLDRIGGTGHHFSRLTGGGGKQGFIVTGGVYKEQSYLLSESFPADWLQKRWDEGFRISDWTGLLRARSVLNEATEEHFMALSRIPGIGGQTYYFEKDSEKYPEEWAAEWSGKGFKLTSCGYVQNSWALVFSEMPSLRQQVILGPKTEFPEDEIKEYKDKGYKITTTCSGFLPSTAPAWVVAMTRTADYTDQNHVRTKEFPWAFIKEHWDVGYRITSIANRSDWLVVMSRGPGLEKLDQRAIIRSYFPNATINYFGSKGLKVTGVANGGY